MRLLRVRVRRFRGVDDREVRFAAQGVTVVEGDNEIGKTSLLDGLDMLLERLDNSQHPTVRAARQDHADGGPEVEADLSCGPYRLTYRKRWLDQPETALTIHEPRPERLAGAEAHDRVRMILAETVDLSLWAALRVQQAQPLAQAELGDNATLGRALDLAAGASAAPDDEHAVDLLDRAEAAYRACFTPQTGRPAGEYARAIEELEDATARRAERQDKLEQMRRAADFAERLDGELADLERRRAESTRRLAGLERTWRGLEARQAEAARLEQAGAAARLAAAGAQRDQDDRSELAEELERRSAAQARLAADAADQRERLGEARSLAQEAERRRAELAERMASADERVERLAGDERLLQDRAGLEALSQRRARAEAAMAAAVTAEQDVAACRVDEGLLADLEAAHERVVRAQAAMTAAAAVLRVEALSQVAMDLDGEARILGPGELVDQPVTAAAELVIPGSVRIRVVAGAGEAGLRRALDEAEHEFRRLMARAGVDDLSDARRRMDVRRDAERESAAQRAVVERELDGATLDNLRAQEARLSGRLADSEASRAAEPPLPDGPGAARRLLDEAADHAAACRQETAAAARVASERGQTLLRLESDIRVAEEKAGAAEAAMTEVAAKLEALRSVESDGALAARADEALGRARDAEERARTVARGLAAGDVAAERALLEGERALAERLALEADTKRSQRAELAGRLSVGGSQEAFDAASARLAAARRRHGQLHRHAQAARLLRDVLTTHRNQARRAYAEPFRERLELFAGIVFGAGLSVRLGADLRVESRTLGGVTLPFDHLSQGAREQLSLCARLACATLVSPDDGVPVMIDDALGHTDPERLRRLGAVFTAAAQHAQVIVLTGTPERYRGIGAATLVSLQSAQVWVTPAPQNAGPPPSAWGAADDQDGLAAGGERDDGSLGVGDLAEGPLAGGGDLGDAPLGSGDLGDAPPGGGDLGDGPLPGGGDLAEGPLPGGGDLGDAPLGGEDLEGAPLGGEALAEGPLGDQDRGHRERDASGRGAGAKGLDARGRGNGGLFLPRPRSEADADASRGNPLGPAPPGDRQAPRAGGAADFDLTWSGLAAAGPWQGRAPRGASGGDPLGPLRNGLTEDRHDRPEQPALPRNSASAAPGEAALGAAGTAGDDLAEATDTFPAMPTLPDQAAAAILACLQDVGRDLSKPEILARTGIDPTSWGPAIRELRETGRVRQRTDLDGATYGSV